MRILAHFYREYLEIPQPENSYRNRVMKFACTREILDLREYRYKCSMIYIDTILTFYLYLATTGLIKQPCKPVERQWRANYVRKASTI